MIFQSPSFWLYEARRGKPCHENPSSLLVREAQLKIKHLFSKELVITIYRTPVIRLASAVAFARLGLLSLCSSLGRFARSNSWAHRLYTPDAHVCFRVCCEPRTGIYRGNLSNHAKSEYVELGRHVISSEPVSKVVIADFPRHPHEQAQWFWGFQGIRISGAKDAATNRKAERLVNLKGSKICFYLCREKDQETRCGPSWPIDGQLVPRRCKCQAMAPFRVVRRAN